MTQTAVCNRHHSIERQLSRWLLLCLDRLPTNRVIVTQELMASMLGVRREGITEAAGKLQKLGVITCQRGHITVLDRRRWNSCPAGASVGSAARRHQSGLADLLLTEGDSAGSVQCGYHGVGPEV